MLITTKLKSFFGGLLTPRKKDFQKRPEQEETFTYQNEYQEKYNFYKIKNNTKGYLTNNVATLSILPVIYLLSSLLIIIILLFIRYINMIEFSTDIKYKNIKIPNYFDLPKINPFIYNIYTCSTSITGLSIVIILYSVLKQRFKVPEYQNHSFKLNVTMVFGIASNVINFTKGISWPIFESYCNIVKDYQPNLEIDFSHLAFLLFIFFTILFSVYSISILNLLRGRNNLNANRMNEDIWYLYKFITLIYLCFFTLVYIAFLLHGSKIFKIGLLDNVMKDNYVTVIAMFPYFIHVINSVLMFTFFFELKFVNLALSQNLDVDYLFEDDKYAI
jgi:hypothetical protein